MSLNRLEGQWELSGAINKNVWFVVSVRIAKLVVGCC